MLKVYRGDNPNNFVKLQNLRFFKALAHQSNKNIAKIFFYTNSTTQALAYGSFISTWNVPTKWKILDLRTDAGRRILAPYMKEYLSDFYESWIRHWQYELHQEKYFDGKSLKINTASRKKKFEEKIKVLNLQIENLNKNIFYDDSLATLNTQNSSDFANGLRLKKALYQLGYDGFCFEEFKDVTYGFIERPTLDLEKYFTLLDKATKLKAKFSVSAVLNNDFAVNKNSRDWHKILKIIQYRTVVNLVDSDSKSAKWFVGSNLGSFKITLPRDKSTSIIDIDSVKYQ